jgi:hypothetical protein
MSTITAFVLVAASSALGRFVVYYMFHKWWENWFTRVVAAEAATYAALLCYIAYNTLAQYFSWPVGADLPVVREVIYGVIALVQVFGLVVFAALTISDRRRRSQTGLSTGDISGDLPSTNTTPG